MEEMLTINPKEIATRDLHQFILGSVAPRPIAFASTIDENGIPNLAPYSFFNAFSSNPPILVFSSNRKVEDNTTKDTLHNIKVNKEVVINVVNYSIVRQMAIASVEYDSNIDEFAKTGLTALASETVTPPRIKESPVHMECKVKEIITLGDGGGAGHLIICEVIRMHVSKSVMDDRNRIDPQKIDLVARLGKTYYARIKGDCIFELHQAVNQIPIGWDGLPEELKESKVFTGHDLGVFASKLAFPSEEQIAEVIANDHKVKSLMVGGASKELQSYARQLISEGKEEEAFCIAMASLGS